MVAPALWGADQTLEFGLPQQQPLRKGYECQELIWEWSLEAHVGERGKERGKGVFTRSSPWATGKDLWRGCRPLLRLAHLRTKQAGGLYTKSHPSCIEICS